MNRSKRNTSSIFLILGLAFLMIGISTNNASFSWAAIAFVLISLVFGGKWTRRGKK